MITTTTEDILGYRVIQDPQAHCLDVVADWIATGDGHRWLACLNPHSYALALNDPPFARALRAADWLIPDGAGTVLASKLLGGQIRDRITGSDVFWGLNRRLDARGGCSCFCLGSSEDTLGLITARLARDFPNVRVAGVYAPPFKGEFSPEDDAAMLAAINAVRPDVLWVGMTAPKQEKWIARHQDQLDVKLYKFRPPS